MKKEYLILIAVIILAGSYLLLHKENHENYKLPEIEEIDTSKLTGIVLNNPQGDIKFTKKEKKWVLTDQEFPADSTSVQNMFDHLKTFKLTALVSQKQDLQRYELDEKKQVHVQLLENGRSIFAFAIGKSAPSFNHTFVMIADDKNIFYAKGTLRGDFNKSMDEYRDKKVLEFHETAIKKFSIEKNGKSKTFLAEEEKKQEKTSDIIWKSEDGTSTDNDTAAELLSDISFLNCEKYPDTPGKEDLKDTKPLCRIQLENKDVMDLILYEDAKHDTLLGISSMNDYVFLLNESKGKKIVENIDRLLGIEKKEDAENKKNPV